MIRRVNQINGMADAGKFDMKLMQRCNHRAACCFRNLSRRICFVKRVNLVLNMYDVRLEQRQAGADEHEVTMRPSVTGLKPGNPITTPERRAEPPGAPAQPEPRPLGPLGPQMLQQPIGIVADAVDGRRGVPAHEHHS